MGKPRLPPLFCSNFTSNYCKTRGIRDENSALILIVTTKNYMGDEKRMRDASLPSVKI